MNVQQPNKNQGVKERVSSARNSVQGSAKQETKQVYQQKKKPEEEAKTSAEKKPKGRKDKPNSFFNLLSNSLKPQENDGPDSDKES